MEAPPLVQFAILVGSGFIGAFSAQFLVVSWTTRRERAAKLMDDFLSKRPRYAEALEALNDPTLLDQPEKMNLVTEFGDWYDIVALLCKEQLADRGIVERAGLVELARRYYLRVDKVTTGLPKGDTKDALHASLAAWSYLHEF